MRAQGAIAIQAERPYDPMIHRYSSRRSPLKDFLVVRLQGVRRYDRFAGFFSSSHSYPIYKVNDHVCLVPESVN